MTKAYFIDAGTAAGEHRQTVEHEELELTDAELKRLKRRAVRAVSMDQQPTERPRPAEYQQFLDGGQTGQASADETYSTFLSGKH